MNRFLVLFRERLQINEILRKEFHIRSSPIFPLVVNSSPEIEYRSEKSVLAVREY
jgi:hypothetical protein